MYKNIFLTYNEESNFGQNTALRLQTISNIYGLSVMLPSRFAHPSSSVSFPSQERISQSSIIVAFGLENLTKTMQSELKCAMDLGKPIIMINDKDLGKTVDFDSYGNVKEVAVDFLDTDRAIHEIAGFLEELPTESKEEKKDIGLGAALLGVGVGLLALWALTKE